MGRVMGVVGIACLGLLLGACGPAAVDGAAVAPAAASSSTAPSASGSSPSPRATTSPATPSGSPSDGVLPTVLPENPVSPSGPVPDVIFRVKTRRPVFFITVDDGVSKQAAALDYVTARHLPVTTFLYNGVVDGRYSYFKGMSAYDAVQNHTMDHKALSKRSTNRVYEICQAQKVYAAKFGVKPWILRPPYGAGFMPRRATTPLILSAAGSCGIKHVVLWDVSVEPNGKVSFANGGSLQAGDIVLLHYEGDLASNLRKVVAMGRRAGLTPASLSAFLPR